ncbi:hypothetical protein BE20_02950 [Sorangium cellulosum]|uniref:Uncharacterized protein n=1 Tax=Sorangium cellulosum TaxID=56 RepID=A0A150S089_SORCE|nr:hypothetical protein BE18_53095 [Sorangium cellulosum]KYF87211.1 hypothetical protein BE20_02950 [Sorangium cellulosum]
MASSFRGKRGRTMWLGYDGKAQVFAAGLGAEDHRVVGRAVREREERRHEGIAGQVEQAGGDAVGLSGAQGAPLVGEHVRLAARRQAEAVRDVALERAEPRAVDGLSGGEVRPTPR